jgi:hypothetical protein
MGGRGARQEYEHGDKEDFRALQGHAVIEGQAADDQESSKSVAFSCGMHSRVAIRETENSDGSQQQEQDTEREESDGADIHCFSPLRDPLQVEVLREGECADEIDEGVDESDIDEEINRMSAIVFVPMTLTEMILLMIPGPLSAL